MLNKYQIKYKKKLLMFVKVQQDLQQNSLSIVQSSMLQFFLFFHYYCQKRKSMTQKIVQIVGLDTQFQQKTDNSLWKSQIFVWDIMCKYQSGKSQMFLIQLESFTLKSVRTLKVNGEERFTIKNSTIGLKKQFHICDGLIGKISQLPFKQDFELLLNGKSFQELAKRQHIYQPPSILKDQQLKKHQINIQQKTSKPIIGLNLLNTEKNQVVPKINRPIEEPQISTQLKIKDTQKELMKILLQAKKKKIQITQK